MCIRMATELKLDTVVLIDLASVPSHSPSVYDYSDHYERYSTIADYLHEIIRITNIENIVYASYGSKYETNDSCTDLIFKNRHKFPGTLNKISAYSWHEQEDIFRDKNILLAGISFYTCMAQRELGFHSLLKNKEIKGVYCSPCLTGYYGDDGYDVPEDAFSKTGIKQKLVIATDKDFVNDHRFKWECKELADIYRVFKANPINSST